jgi:hypothetical protein
MLASLCIWSRYPSRLDCKSVCLPLCVCACATRQDLSARASVCVLACVYVPVRTEKDAMRVCVCVPMCLFSNMINMIGKRVLDHVLHERVPKNIYRGGLLCTFSLKASSSRV